MANHLNGRVAVVTGSGRGIGAAIAMAMAKEGAKVVTNDVVAGSAEATAREIVSAGGQAVPFTGDISDFATAEKLVKTAADSFGRLDILVNNAGIVRWAMVWEMAEADFDRVVEVSLNGAFNCIRHASGLMVKQGWGRILNVSSVVWLGSVDVSNYCAAKAGVIGLTRAVALDVAKHGITCNAFCPMAETQMRPIEERVQHFNRVVEAGLLDRSRFDEVVLHPPSPDTVPPFLVYLCTDAASHVTGQVFRIFGNTIGIFSEPSVVHSINKETGMWSIDELIEQAPNGLLTGYKHPMDKQRYGK